MGKKINDKEVLIIRPFSISGGPIKYGDDDQNKIQALLKKNGLSPETRNPIRALRHHYIETTYIPGIVDAVRDFSLRTTRISYEHSGESYAYIIVEADSVDNLNKATQAVKAFLPSAYKERYDLSSNMTSTGRLIRPEGVTLEDGTYMSLSLGGGNTPTVSGNVVKAEERVMTLKTAWEAEDDEVPQEGFMVTPGRRSGTRLFIKVEENEVSLFTMEREFRVTHNRLLGEKTPFSIKAASVKTLG